MTQARSAVGSAMGSAMATGSAGAAPHAAACRWLPLGDSGLTLELGQQITPELVAQVAALERRIAQAHAAGALPGLIETVPTFRSLTLLYDPLQTRRAALDAALAPLVDEVLQAHAVSAAAVATAEADADALQANRLEPSRAPPDAEAAVWPHARHWRLPVCYGPVWGDAQAWGVDLPDVAQRLGLSEAEVVARHSASRFRVYMLGFMPGFAFMGGLDPMLAVPRRREPRVRVPAGSVAITGPLTAVYPWASPGGWSLIGRCPVPLFDAARAQPSLLAPGDVVQFEAVERARCEAIAAELAAGDDPVARFCSPARGEAAPQDCSRADTPGAGAQAEGPSASGRAR